MSSGSRIQDIDACGKPKDNYRCRKLFRGALNRIDRVNTYSIKNIIVIAWLYAGGTHSMTTMRPTC
jgi:hypothetical protein